jgi:hypothetical protein
MKVEISLNENVKVFSVLEWMYIDLLVDDCGCDWIGMCCFDERRLKVVKVPNVLQCVHVVDDLRCSLLLLLLFR